MKDTEVTKENRSLVRQFIANLRIVKPQGDQAAYRLALAKKLFVELDKLEESHWLRLYEALAHVDFPAIEIAHLRDHVSRKLASIQDLKSVRGIIIPPVALPSSPKR